jgi:hypothetical protein
MQPEIGLRATITADIGAAGEFLRHRHHQSCADGRESRVVERLRFPPIGNRYARMVDHVASPPAAAGLPPFSFICVQLV